MKRKNERIAYLPIVILAAVTPAVMGPLLQAIHLQDSVKGLAMGIPIGLALVGLIWMIRGFRPSL